MKDFKDKVIAITGTGSGIGKSLAILLANEGAKVAISDINQAALDETHQLIETAGGQCHSQQLDVADRKAFYAWADAVENHFGEVHGIVNNAGVALGATVEGVEYDDFEWLMNINFWGVVYGTKAFLPKIKAAGGGHIVNVSSVFGMIGVPTQATYNAAKFAVKGFTEAFDFHFLA